MWKEQMGETDEHKTALQHEVNEGKLYPSTELCTYVWNTSTNLCYMFLLHQCIKCASLKVCGFLAYYTLISQEISAVISPISHAAEIKTTMVTYIYI